MSSNADRRDPGTGVGVLWGAFAIQIAGRLLDARWHATHDEFETGVDQVQAHWLVWLGTILVLVVGVRALRSVSERDLRVGYLGLVAANAIYVLLAIVHFIQHQNHQEVEWTHAGLGITNLVGVVAVLYVTFMAMSTTRNSGREPG